MAAPGLEKRWPDWKPCALPDQPHCSLSHAHFCTKVNTGQDPIPDISGAEWGHLDRSLIDANTEDEEENDRRPKTCASLSLNLFFFIDFRGRERERETSVRENIDWLPPACPPLGIWPTTWACAPTRN
uniref:Uncharacterized protein n=1 Tax=Molossus molossus TaxID=27622 RepID=A0A7J8DCB1_MOLMO|nr:hypothetical protein HJG59_009359 [Molossus molossus]